MNDLVAIVQSGKLADIPQRKYAFTLDPKDKASRKLLATAIQGQVPSIMEAVNMELEVQHLLFHTVSKVNPDTGEVRILPRLVLFCKDGKMYSTSGEKAINDVLLPATLFGIELPYKPPQRFMVKRIKSSIPDRFYASLEWIEGAK